jgi:5'-3' exonuclease
MGIKGLSALIKRFAPEGQKTVPLGALARGWYAVDVSGYLYASQYNAEHKGKNNHIRDFFNLISKGAEHGLRFVFVFDGNTHSAAKQGTISDRAEKTQGQKDRIKTLLDLDPAADERQTSSDLKALGLTRLKGDLPAEDRIELGLLLRNFIVITPQCYADLKLLFQYVGAPFIRAQGEADFVCAALSRAGLVQGVISEDMDMLSHGVGLLVRGLMNARSNDVTCYTLAAVLAGMELTLAQFHELSVLCGCDYASKLDGVAGVRGLTLLKKFKTIAGILADGKITAPAEFSAAAARAVEIFSSNQEELPGDFTLPSGYTIDPAVKEWLGTITGPVANLDGKLKIIERV